MSSYFKYNINNINKQHFSIEQEEIILESTNIVDLKKVNFIKKNIIYDCIFEKKCEILKEKPGAILCIKDNLDLLKFTFSKLKETNNLDYINLLIVDDRPSDKKIRDFCATNSINYISVDNKSHFNFSMLNNIGANIFHENGCRDIILWNSDLWPGNDTSLKNIIDLHVEMNNAITGTRLMYPSKSWNGTEDVPENISNFFKGAEKTYRDTIQFGGCIFSFVNNGYYPNHFARFTNNSYAYKNGYVHFITGAFTIIKSDIFFELGCLNPSLSSQFQDVDFSLRCREKEYNVFYVGEEFMLHDESVSLKEKDKHISYHNDHILYYKLWCENNKINKILFGDKI